MVTHRWWGNKFCKRACKNAHRRENHHTQSGWVIPRFFTLAGGACLAAAVAVAMLTLLLASAYAAPGEERPVAGASAFLFSTLLADLGTAKLLYILVATSLLGAVITWLFCIETTCVNLEEIGAETNRTRVTA